MSGSSYTYDDGNGFAALAFLIVLLPLLLISIFAGYIISSFFLMKIFEKAGVQGKWRAWVPIYNTLVAAKLGDVSPWAYLIVVVGASVLSNIPVIGFVFGLVALAASVVVAWRIGLKFGKDWPLLLLWLIPGVGTLIWLGILAFGSARWNPAIAPAPWANTIAADKTVWDGVPVQPGQQVTGTGGPGYGGPGYGGPAAGSTPPPAPGSTPPPPAPPQF
ncbi:large exoprotein [Microbacterium proteolyticum]|uniref:large exoprotein n=1 Tax=Microbacterium proteolyticum TaxID=1572644 RepID=UPI001FAB66A3|nr:large exoprotein [Microbacterium proteolyticum]MCI9858614.1 large exoprotein [Microbacterium proteolyticum]